MIREFSSETLPWAVGLDGKYAAVKRDDYTASVLDTESGDEVARVHAADQIEAMAFRPDSQTVALAGLGKRIELWEIDTGGSDILRTNFDGDFQGTSFSSDEAALTVLSAEGNRLRADSWALTGKRESSRQALDAAGNLAAFSADGRYLALASGVTAAVINRVDGNTVRSLRFEGNATAIALSGEGTSLAIATDAGVVVLWQVATSTPPLRFDVRGIVRPGSLAVAPAGTTLTAIASEGVSRRGETLVTHVWKPPITPRSPRISLGVDRSGLSSMPCAVSTDARYVAANQASDVVVVRKAVDSRTIATLNHPGTSRNCAFSADGRVLATSGSGVVRIWDIETQVEVARVEQADDVRDLIFSPRGRYLATVGQKDSVRVWLLQPADLVDTACGRLTVNLSPEEWRGYSATSPTGQRAHALPFGRARAGDPAKQGDPICWRPL